MGDEPVGIVWGPINAEDLLQVPGTDWIITSGMTGPGAPLGRLYAVCAAALTATEVFPYLATAALDAARFGEQAVPDFGGFAPHGIDIAVRGDGVAELYLVNHGGRESVEVFEILLDGLRPALRWIGAVVLPGTSYGNDVAAAPGGGFIVSTCGDPAGGPLVLPGERLAGEPTGGVLEWCPRGGWKELPGTQINIANGVALSPDGEWVFLGGWGLNEIRKVRRGVPEPEVLTVPAPIKVDNFTWTADGKLISAGAFDTTTEDYVARHFGGEPRLCLPTRVIRIDPATLAIEILIEYGTDGFGCGTTGLVVGEEIWVGAARDQGLARFALPRGVA